MLAQLVDLFLAGTVFNRVSQDACIDTVNIEQLVEYLFSYLITRK